MTNISTQVAGTSDILRSSLASTLLGITLASFAIFLCFLGIMLSVYVSNHHVRQEVRYVLFAHLLVSDSFYLLITLFLFLVVHYSVTYPAPLCYTFVLLTSSSLKIAPYNLAIMSLERYVAICHPLRHGEICTLHRAGVSFAVIWVIAVVPNCADVVILTLSVDRTFFSRYLICNRPLFIVQPIQDTIRLFAHAITFSLVGLIIIFTYVKIMLVALKAKSRNSSASKAGMTVMLHAIQLLLCMTAFSYSVFQILLKDYIALLPIINFCFFMCLPRFLSPVIYGVRDEIFWKHIKKHVFCKLCKGKVGYK